ncbi:uncharacterized protein LOC143236094 [Tachypleus tridentatus]|uniref:uncharacterized protein LOC143236094 n=1 Tax=Tachypleus tridentatus TaxID=6853 RepID=UPI003FD057D9
MLSVFFLSTPARLPFKVLDISSTLPTSSPNQKKRKLSEEDVGKVSKTPREEFSTKECVSVANNSQIIDTSAEAENIPVVSSKVSSIVENCDIRNQSDEVVEVNIENSTTEIENESKIEVYVHPGQQITDISTLDTHATEHNKTGSCPLSVVLEKWPGNKSTETKEGHSEQPAEVESTNNYEYLEHSSPGDTSTSSVGAEDTSVIESKDEGVTAVETSDTSKIHEECKEHGIKRTLSQRSVKREVKKENDKGRKVPHETFEERLKRKKTRERKVKERKGKDQKEAKERKKRERLEIKAKKEKEKQEKKDKEEREKQEKIRVKQERKEKEERERQEKYKQKEEERQKKLQILNAKLEEKKKKDEERQKKLEEKRRAEEEEERKKEKAKATFASFFVKAEPNFVISEEKQQGIFLPFEVKQNMVLAPVVPEFSSANFDKENMEKQLQGQGPRMTYLEELKKEKHKPFWTKKCQKVEINEEEDIFIESEERKMRPKLKVKLLQFCENVRPPYWGTWRKISTSVNPRRPFSRDVIFDYEVDSDEEWEEGGPGESLSGTEDEKESEDEYEVDNEFFVPHGYLSTDEEQDDEGNPVDTPETHKLRLKVREEEFEAERKNKCPTLKPQMIGCLWDDDDRPGQEELRKALEQYRAVILATRPIATSLSLAKLSCEDDTSVINSNGSAANTTMVEGGTPRQSQKRPVPEEAMPHLIRLIHANVLGRSVLIREFQQYWVQFCEGNNQTSVGESIKNLTNLQSASDEEQGQKTDAVISQASPVNDKNVCYKISKRQLEITFQKIASWKTMPHLIRLIHANVLGRSVLIREFQQYWVQFCEGNNQTSVGESIKNLTNLQSASDEEQGQKTDAVISQASPVNDKNVCYKISKRQLEITFQKIASWKRCDLPSFNKFCWWIHQDVLEKYGLQDLPIPNRWQYVSRKDPEPVQPISTPNSGTGNNCSITKFTCKIDKSSPNIVSPRPLHETETTKERRRITPTLISSLLPSKDKQIVCGDDKKTQPILKFTRRITPVTVSSTTCNSKHPLFGKEPSSVCHETEKHNFQTRPDRMALHNLAIEKDKNKVSSRNFSRANCSVNESIVEAEVIIVD